LRGTPIYTEHVEVSKPSPNTGLPRRKNSSQ